MSRNHPLNMEDESFYKQNLNELSTFEALIKPQMHQILQRREKVNALRVTLASTCVPDLIEFKDMVEKQVVPQLAESVGKGEISIKPIQQRRYDYK